MKKLPLFLLTFFILLAVLIVSYFAILYLLDGSTTVILRGYEVTGHAEMVRNHLVEYRGEAEGHETAIGFLAWGMERPNDFVAIVEGIEPSQKADVCGRIAFAATDTSLGEKFETVFQGHDSECLRIIRSDILKNRSYQRP